MNTGKQPLPNLVVSRDEASEKIQARIAKGQELRDQPIRSEPELEEARAEYDKWSSYNSTLLLTLYDDPSIENRYRREIYISVVVRNLSAFHTEIDRYRKNVTAKINRLKEICGELELIPERISSSTSVSPPAQTPANSNEVFIVHGHDRAAKSEVARFVEKLGPEVTVLDEQPGGGQTIIEKFEAYASNAGFAIVLLTPDDVGAAKDKRDNLNPRARQNVIFEMGYFVKGLGRGSVCAMSSEEVELPSDLAGVEYIRLDANGGWQRKLVREMREAGLTVDLEKVF